MVQKFSFADWYRIQRDYVLRDFQKVLLDDSLETPFVAVLGSRQIGKTRYLAILAILLAGGVSTKSGKIPAHDVYIISSTYDKAQNVIKEVQSVLIELNLIDKITHDVMGGKTSAVLKNGMTIMAVAGKPGCLQGYAGSCLWDEASLTEHDPADIYTQILAASSAESYYRVVMCTNADRIGSWVWEFFHSPTTEWKNVRSEFRVHDITIYNAYPDGLPPHIELRKRMLSTGSGWSRFYLNQFVSGDQGRFDESIIKKAIAQTWSCDDGLRILSLDPGFSRNGHPAGVTVVSISSGKVEVLHADLWFAVPEEQQRKQVGELVEQYNVSRILIDQGVGGLIVKDNLIRQYGEHMVKAVSVSGNKYSLWCTELEKLMTEGNLNISYDQKYLIEDLKSIEVDSRGNVVVTERAHTNGTNRIHCDAGVSLMFAMDHVGGQLDRGHAEEVDVGNSYGTDISFGFDNSYDKFI